MEQLNVCLGAVVALLVLWHMDVQVQSGLSFHLLGVTAITLMFGWSLAVIGAYSFADLSETVLPFFPLMFMPEAFLNGWILAVLVAFKPQWVYSFSDEQYLKGK
jgi:uncharacterized membrane protein